jgi:hypothetical protein
MFRAATKWVGVGDDIGIMVGQIGVTCFEKKHLASVIVAPSRGKPRARRSRANDADVISRHRPSPLIECRG